MGKAVTWGSLLASHRLVHAGQNVARGLNTAMFHIAAHWSLDPGVFVLERNHRNAVCGKGFTQRSQDGNIRSGNFPSAVRIAKPVLEFKF